MRLPLPKRLRAFTLVELLVVIAVIAILAAILFPVFARAREKARQTNCISNMRQVAQAMHMYMTDHDDRVPVCHDDTTASTSDDTLFWWVTLFRYTRNDGVFICPSWRATTAPSGLLATEVPPNPQLPNRHGGIAGTYVWNESMDGAPESRLSGTASDGLSFSPAAVIVVGEGFNGGHVWKPEHVAPLANPEDRLRYFHNDGANFAFADGHAKWLSGQSMRRSLWAPYNAAWRP